MTWTRQPQGPGCRSSAGASTVVVRILPRTRTAGSWAMMRSLRVRTGTRWAMSARADFAWAMFAPPLTRHPRPIDGALAVGKAPVAPRFGRAPPGRPPTC